jgi:coenzyme F420-reducing hydrogenase delta subunit
VSENFKNPRPRLIGFLCENGAHVFYDVSNPVRRKLPANFIGLPVASIDQVQTNELLKAFLSGADGVLIVGCEDCQREKERLQFDEKFVEMLQTLDSLGVQPSRIRFEWMARMDEEKFLAAVGEMMDSLRRLPKLRLPAGLGKNVVYCG